MSSMNFPTSPSDGDIYRKWQYSAATSSWTLHGVSGVTGDLGVLTINGQTFDPMADSDLSVTVAAGDIGVSYGSSAPVSAGTNAGEEFFVTSDGTSGGVVEDGYIWNGTTWTSQSTTLDGSVSGNDF